MRMKLLFIIWAACALVGSTFAEDGDGGYAGSFLQVPIGARPTALGGAYTGVSNDGAGPLFNPAGLSSVIRPIFATSYRAMKLDRKLGYVSAIFPIKNRGVLGVSWLYAGSGKVAERDVNGYLTGQDFSNNNHMFSLIFAKRFEELAAFGAKANYFHSTIPSDNAFSVGFDFGVMLYADQLFSREKRDLMPVKDIQVGLTVKNIGNKFPWNSQKYNLSRPEGSDVGFEQDDKIPVEVGLGASARFLNRKLLLAVDGVKNAEQAAQVKAGGEFFVTPEFALRAGYGHGRFSAGTGYLFSLGKRGLAIDYAFSTDRADEGSEHIFSIDFLY